MICTQWNEKSVQKYSKCAETLKVCRSFSKCADNLHTIFNLHTSKCAEGFQSVQKHSKCADNKGEVWGWGEEGKV
jgi:hypothetical protein